jgi:lysozyme
MGYTPQTQPRRRARRKDERILAAIAAAAVICIAAVIAAALVHENRAREAARTTTAKPTSVVYMGYTVALYDNLERNGRTEGVYTYLGGLLTSADARTGIDVSQHQGEIDWERVAEQGVEFAFLRIGYRGYTEGQMYEDTRFEEYYEGARAAGIDVGVYFYSQAVTVVEARLEAAFVLEKLNGREVELPVAIDWEYAKAETARTDEIGGNLLTSISKTFCEMIESEGYDAAIYFSKDTGYTQYNLGQLADYAFWVADYSDRPVFYYAHEFWQYSDKGHVDGIPEPVDLDLWFIE